MNEETQILLKEFVDAVKNLDGLVEAINSPDWWLIGITVVNALIMIWLGWNQYKLQKRQTETVEYEIYKQLYLVVCDANKEIDNFLRNLWDGLWEPIRKTDPNCLQIRYDNINRIRTEFSQYIVDFKLKFSQKFFDQDGCRDILALMSQILQYTDELVRNNAIQIAIGTQELSYEDCIDEAIVEDIINRIKKKADREIYSLLLKSFVARKSQLKKDDVLGKIRAKCKID